MADTSDFKNGLVLEYKNNLFKIIDFLHVKPGKGGAFVRTKLKNIKTGQVIDETFRSGEKISVVRLDAQEFNYLYKDLDGYYFMNNEGEFPFRDKGIKVPLFEDILENYPDTYLNLELKSNNPSKQPTVSIAQK